MMIPEIIISIIYTILIVTPLIEFARTSYRVSSTRLF